MARDLDGVSDNYLTVPGSGTFGSLTSAYTAAGWIQLDTAQTSCPSFFAFNYSGTNIPIVLTIADGTTPPSSTAGRWAAGYYNTATGWKGGCADTIAAPTGSTWYHMGVTWDGTNLRLWRNGTNTNSTSGGAGPSTTTQAFRIGRRWDGTTNTRIDGRIAECGIWNVALTTGEMTSLANGAKPSSVRAGALVGYYPFYGNVSTDAELSSGAGGTVTQNGLVPGVRIMPPMHQDPPVIA